MVGEFPELQGVMGRYYALHDGEAPRVADAIAEHYKPLGPNDACPSAKPSIIVALADKLDSLARFFWIGERPTGSGDPFALRRAALGVIRIILENNLRLPLTSAFNKAVDPVPEFSPDQVIQIVGELIRFIADRLWVQLRGRGVRHDLINAVFEVREDDLIRVLARVDALQSFLETDDGSSLLIAYRRAANIVSIEERRDQRRYNDEDYDPRGSQGEERALSIELDQIAVEVRELVKKEKFEQAMAALATLRQPVDAFFDKVTVNTEEKIVIDGKEKSLRENRLRLLSRIQAVMDQVAKFYQIEG
jgi:glycyl-tRNA synthetase beta chain